MSNLTPSGKPFLEELHKLFDSGGLEVLPGRSMSVISPRDKSKIWQEWILLLDHDRALRYLAPASMQEVYCGLSDNKLLTAPSLRLELGFEEDITTEVCDMSWREYVRDYRNGVIGKSDKSGSNLQMPTLQQLMSFGTCYSRNIPSRNSLLFKPRPQVPQQQWYMSSLVSRETFEANRSPYTIFKDNPKPRGEGFSHGTKGCTDQSLDKTVDPRSATSHRSSARPPPALRHTQQSSHNPLLLSHLIPHPSLFTYTRPTPLSVRHTPSLRVPRPPSPPVIHQAIEAAIEIPSVVVNEERIDDRGNSNLGTTSSMGQKPSLLPYPSMSNHQSAPVLHKPVLLKPSQSSESSDRGHHEGVYKGVAADRSKGSGNRELINHCTPARVNITLAKIPLSIEEIMTYFPLATKFFEIDLRYKTHGWGEPKIRNYIYWSRELTHRLALSRTTMHHAISKGMKYYEKNPGLLDPTTLSATPSRTDMTKDSDMRSLHDLPLVDLAKGVKHHPEGVGRQGLTHAIEHALQNGHDTVMLSEVREYVLRHGIFDIEAPYDCAAADKAALKRVDQKAQEYYKANVYNSWY